MANVNQDALNAINADLIAITEQYVSGMITVQEFVDGIARRKPQTDRLDYAGLFCPNTGLRYPTKEETDKFMEEFENVTR